jgi:hypothetical protein
VIREFEFYHGAVLARLLHGARSECSIRVFETRSNSSYVVNSEVGIYIKYSSKRLTPWRFTFTKEHRAEIERLRKAVSRTFVLLLCHDDGVVCLTQDELKQILEPEYSDVEWVSASRRRREMYSIKGSDGSLEFKIGQGQFPGKLFS